MKYFFHIRCNIMIPVKSISYLREMGSVFLKAIWLKEKCCFIADLCLSEAKGM